MQFSNSILTRTLVLGAIMFSAGSAFAENNACAVLTAEKFSELAGYKVVVNKEASTDAVCIYKGSGAAGGILMILDEEATPQKLELVNRTGSVPQGKPGKLGATFSKGRIVFSVGIAGTDPAKVNAIAAEVKRNLK